MIAPWKKSYDQPRQHIKKHRCYFANKCPVVGKTKALSKTKAMVFPVVMYGCESWTIKKAECRRIDTFELCMLEKTPEGPLDYKKIQPFHPKGNQS